MVKWICTCGREFTSLYDADEHIRTNAKLVQDKQGVRVIHGYCIQVPPNRMARLQG
jgi:hypothetical protein